MKDLNILIVGVGGQGTLLASVLLGSLALESGYDVKLAEVHGMAQRGGSVVTHVRISDREVHSPLIEEGGADVIVAFELLEGYRWLSYLKPGGTLLVNNRRINPMPVIIGSAEYPARIPETMNETVGRTIFVDADRLAREAGSIKAANTVLMGALSKTLPFGEDEWLARIEKSVKPGFVELNKKAFLLGREEMQ